MEKRYQVFLSSTFVDLKEERAEVIQALLELDCIPAGMELFPAADETQWALIQRVIDDCDYYAVIVGGRYGSTDSDGISYTEREYDYAVARKIPVLGFVHAEPSEIAAGKSELESAAREKLAAFRSKVRKRMCKEWRTAAELGGVVSRSISQAIKTRPAEGWVRARYASSPEQLNALRSEIDVLRSQLEKVRTEPPAEAERLAKGNELFRVRYTLEISDTYNEFPLTWDELFGALAPLMLGEASESQLQKQLASKITADKQFDFRFGLVVADEDFQTAKVQLFALGLIQRSEKKRAASDTQTYWTLTPYGERYLMALKAIPTK